MPELPRSCEIYFSYECKKCGSTWTATQKEVSLDGFKIVCACGTVLHLATLTNIRVKYSRKKNIHSGNHPAIGILVQLGFTVREAQNKIRENLGKTTEEIIEIALRDEN